MQLINRINAEHENMILKTNAEIQEATLLNIAQEIHDNINLSLTLAKLHMNNFVYNKNKEVHLVHESIDQISKAISDLRDLSKTLNPEVICNIGLVPVLNSFFENIRKTKLVVVEFSTTGISYYIDHKIELLLFRIVQEAFQNIIKHAKAKSIKVRLTFQNSDLKLEIQDDGLGFDKETLKNLKTENRALGFTHIFQRVKLLNGQCIVDSSPGKGTLIEILIPNNNYGSSN